MTTDLAVFLFLAAIAIISAISMLFARNSVYSALFLVLNLATVAVLYLLLNAAFIAMVQVTVYTGAIMVLFLFVIMLLGSQQAATGPDLPWQMPVAIGLGLALMATLGFALLGRYPGLALASQAVLQGFGSPQAVGELLFSRYLLPFEATSVLLLAAMVGAIALTRDEPEGKPR
jgi:NADH-quinone oxidoreductase subunit J